MAVVFGKQSGGSAVKKSVVDAVFERDVLVLDETEADAPAAPGQIRVMRNYRGHTAKGPGRKNPLLGQTVVDLSALGLVTLDDVPNLIARLSALQSDLADTGL